MRQTLAGKLLDPGITAPLSPRPPAFFCQRCPFSFLSREITKRWTLYYPEEELNWSSPSACPDAWERFSDGHVT